MKVLVTGGIGRVGTAAVKRLCAKGYEVRIIDQKPDAQAPEGTEYAVCDINDFPALREQLRGCQAIVHLAAIASPTGVTPQDVFRVDAGGTFNVFQAAAEEGIRRVVQASSINALGMHFGIRNVDPDYFPVDEEQSPYSTDAYSFSKWIAEEIGGYFYRREGINSIALRFPSVRPPDTAEQKAERQAVARELVDQAESMDKAAWRDWLTQRLVEINEMRAQRKMEDRPFMRHVYGPNSDFSPTMRWLLSTRSNFWAMIDERDAAQAIEKGLAAPFEGSHALFVCDRNNPTGYDAEMLAQLFYPAVTARKRPLIGKESLVSIEKARRLIGFEPEYTYG